MKLNRVGGRLVSAKSKTGNPACSEAMSAWVRSRHGGAPVGPAVFAMLGKCRSMARQNKKAEQLQASGKLAEGRGTWQRSERAAKLLAERKAKAQSKPAPAGDDFDLGGFSLPKTAPTPAPKPAAASPPARPRAQRGTPERLARARQLRAENPARQQARHDAAEIGKAYQAVSGGKANVRVRLADLREKLPHVPRERQDSALSYLATKKRDAAALYAFDGEHGATAKDRAAALRLPTGHTRDFIYLGGPGSSGLTGRFPVAPRPAPAKSTAPAVVEPPRPGLKDQAAAHRAKKGDTRERARLLAVKAQKKSRNARTTSLKADREGKHEKAAKFDQSYQTNFLRSENLAIRSGIRAPKETGRTIDTKFTILGVTPVPTPKPTAKALSKKARAASGRSPPAPETPDARTKTGPDAPVAAPQRQGTPSDFRAMTQGLRRNAGERRQALATKLKAQRSEVQAARASTVRDLPTDQIHFDPERFQYKLNAHGETGSVGSLAGVKKWDPELGGVLQVWKDPSNGKTFVVNGHNRLDLAKRLGAGKVSVRHITARDAQEARAKGAITNIAEGRGNSTDAAQFFRDTGMTRQDLESRGVPLREKVATEGLALSGLEEGLWRKHKAGELSAERAAIIGGSGLTHAQQAAITRSAGKNGVEGLNNRDLKELLDNAREAPVVRNKTLDLFGGSEDDLSLGSHRAKAQGYVKDRLGKEKRVFGTVAKSRNAAELERAGNRIDTQESGKVAQSAAENLAIFDQLKNRRGPVADLLNEAAERVHQGENPRKVHEDVYRRLPAAIQGMLAGG